MWTVVGNDVIRGLFLNDNAGIVSAMSRDGLVVAAGAPLGVGGVASYVRIFEYSYSGNEWNERGTRISTENSGDEHGSSVALDRDGGTVGHEVEPAAHHRLAEPPAHC